MIYFITLCDKKSYDEKRSYLLEKSFEKYNSNITIEVDDENGNKIMKNSNKYELITLQNYLPHQGKYNKIIQIFNYLRSSDCASKSDDDIILFIDAFDTIVMKPFDGLEESFRATNQDIIFGADNEFKYIYPEAKQFYDKRYANVGPFKYLNSSFYIGYKRSILQFFQYIVNKLSFYPKTDKVISDRRVIGFVLYQAYSKDYSSVNKVLQHLKITIDYECKYFYSKNEDKSINELLVRNPYFLHIPQLGKPTQKSTHLLVAKLKDLI